MLVKRCVSGTGGMPMQSRQIGLTFRGRGVGRRRIPGIVNSKHGPVDRNDDGAPESLVRPDVLCCNVRLCRNVCLCHNVCLHLDVRHCRNACLRRNACLCRSVCLCPYTCLYCAVCWHDEPYGGIICKPFHGLNSPNAGFARGGRFEEREEGRQRGEKTDWVERESARHVKRRAVQRQEGRAYHPNNWPG